MIAAAVASPGLEELLLSVRQTPQLRDSSGKGRNLALVRRKALMSRGLPDDSPAWCQGTVDAQ